MVPRPRTKLLSPLACISKRYPQININLKTHVSFILCRCISAANPPVIVHCSAGIGRTGVLILMDTALALMEAHEPVYPLDIVRTMRDQRACMVQNVVCMKDFYRTPMKILN